uniref:glucuronosyltransferase n=1 Tax=Strongyloides venezuelensis TaxID=75913 RepID=A0A0K0F3H4_STRVS
MFIKHFLLLFNFICITYTYKILVVNPKLAYSHVNFFSQIADILTEAGNDVTVLTINLDPAIKHPGAYKAKVITVPAETEIEDIFISAFNDVVLWDTSPNPLDQVKFVEKIFDGIYKQSMNVFNDENLTEKIRQEKFDLGITEVVNVNVLGMFKVWGIKAYVTGNSMSLGNIYYQPFGLPFPASYVPAIISPFTEKMTYTERLKNLIGHYFFAFGINYFSDKVSFQKEFDEKYGVGFFNSNNAIGDSSFIVINSNPFLDIPGPKTPKMIEVAGIGVKDPKPLDEYWNKILSLRNKTILISFGTYSRTIHMPEDMKKGLLESIRKLNDTTFILKYEEPEDGTGKDIENLVLTKWMPQSDLLNDERISLFVTHGGIGSITELSFIGIPTLVIPIMGDQNRNAKLVERQNYGISMNKLDLKDPDILIKNIKIILGDETYRNNAKMVSKRLNKRPIGSKRLLIEHIEFAAEFGRLDMLDLGSRNMGTIEYYNLDIILPMIFVLVLFAFLLLYITWKIVKKLFTLIKARCCKDFRFDKYTLIRQKHE